MTGSAIALAAFLAAEAVAVIAAIELKRPAEQIVLAAAAVAALGYLWRNFVLPAVRTMRQAGRVYELLASEDSGFVARLHRLEGGLASLRDEVAELLRIHKRLDRHEERLDRAEELAEEARRRVGTREGDPPLSG